MAMRADRTALYLIALAVDLVAAAGFLMWPMDVFGLGSGGILEVALLGPMMLVSPVTWWLLGTLDAASKPLPEGDSE